MSVGRRRAFTGCTHVHGLSCAPPLRCWQQATQRCSPPAVTRLSLRCRAAVSALVTATLASGPLGAVKAAVDAHVATPDWPGVQGVLASSGFVAKLGDFVGAAAFGDAAAITRVNTFAATAAVAAAPSIDTTPAAGYITSARAELDRGQLASLSTTFADNMGDVNAAYASMGSPPSAVSVLCFCVFVCAWQEGGAGGRRGGAAASSTRAAALACGRRWSARPRPCCRTSRRRR